jgi:hypothetical protein
LVAKILAVAGDNASNNDTMVDELRERVEAFPGPSNQVRCFLHTVNLTAKSTIQVFDVPKHKKDGTDVLDKAEAELRALAGSIDVEDIETQLEKALDGPGDELNEEEEQEELENSTEGWIDERELLSQWERDELDKSVRPVRLAIVKVSTTFIKTGNCAHRWSSYGSSHTRSFIQPHCFSQSGSTCLLSWDWKSESCHKMSQLDGTQLMIC